MLLKVGDFELEIQEDLFVCLDDGTITRFCEWKKLEPHVQDTFKALRREMLQTMETFITSDSNLAFTAASEAYGRNDNACLPDAERQVNTCSHEPVGQEPLSTKNIPSAGYGGGDAGIVSG